MPLAAGKAIFIKNAGICRSSLVAREKKDGQVPKILATSNEQQATNSENAAGDFFQQSLKEVVRD